MLEIIQIYINIDILDKTSFRVAGGIIFDNLFIKIRKTRLKNPDTSNKNTNCHLFALKRNFLMLYSININDNSSCFRKF